MDEKITLTQIESEYPEIYNEIFEAGRIAEQKRFSELIKVCGDDVELLTESYFGNNTPSEVLEERIRKLDKTNFQLTTLLDERESRTMSDEQLKQKYAQSKTLQNEFSCAGAYIAHIRHTKDVTVVGGKVVTG